MKGKICFVSLAGALLTRARPVLLAPFSQVVAVSFSCLLAAWFTLIATVTLGLSALPPSLQTSSREQFWFSCDPFSVVILSYFIGVFSILNVLRAPSGVTIGPSQSFLQRTIDMPVRGHSTMRLVVLCLLALSSDIRISVRFPSFVLPSSFFLSSFLPFFLSSFSLPSSLLPCFLPSFLFPSWAVFSQTFCPRCIGNALCD